MGIDKLISRLETYGGLSFAPIVAELVWGLILLGAFIWVRRRVKRAWKRPVLALLAVLMLRVVLFGNPVTWLGGFVMLSPTDVGFRQYDVIKQQLYRYLDLAKGARYLAVGSSQSQAVYSDYGKSHDDFAQYSFAGMGPLDLFLLRRTIEGLAPQNLLLFLSDFDLARKPSTTAVTLAPRQGTGLAMSSYAVFRAGGDEGWRTALDLMLGELSPEYKFRFLFQGVLRKISGQARTTLPDDAEQAQIQFERLRSGIQAAPIDINMWLVERFLVSLSEQSTMIYIVEGQYHPRALSEKNIALQAVVRTRLQNLCAKLSHVAYIPKEAIMVFEEDDYRDAYHVRRERGDVFADRVRTYVESSQR